jgi:hypothetical protein
MTISQTPQDPLPPTRDVSGVPAPLRELLGLLAELAERPPVPADSNWDRRRDAEDSRHSTLSVILNSLNDSLRVHDEVLAAHRRIAEESLARDCQHWISMARQRLAEPLGYEPQPEAAEDGKK